MSNTERAPEPTMEEILASIRRIISDDESNSTQQPATTSDYARQVAAEESEDGAADTQIIDDITRVLSGGAQPAGTEDDILDLAEAGAPAAAPMADLPEPMADLPEPMAEMQADAEFAVSEEVVLGEAYAEPGVDFGAAFPPAGEDMAEPKVMAEVETLVEDSEDSIVAEAADAPESYAMPEPDMAEISQSMAEPTASELPPVSASEAQSEDPTSALERAIAALKAGDLAAFAREAQADYAPTQAAADLDTEPEPEISPESSPAEFASVELEAEALELELEELVLDEPAPEPSALASPAESSTWAEPETESEPEPEPEPEPEDEPQSTADWQSASASWGTGETEPEQNPARTNGGSAHKSHDFDAPMSSKSLEDSVKEMLRPLLRQWLDENMPRVLNAALREELENPERRND